MSTTNPILTLDFETILLSVRESAHKAGEPISRDEAYQRASVEQHRRRQTLIQAAIGVQRRLAAQSAPVVRASSTTSTTPIGSQPGDLPSTLRREVDALTEDGMDLSEAIKSVKADVDAYLAELQEHEEEEDAPRKRTAKAPKAPIAKPKAKAKVANDEDEVEDEDETEEEDEERHDPKPKAQAKPNAKPTGKTKPNAKAEMRDIGDVAREIQARDPGVGWEAAISRAYTIALTAKASETPAPSPRSIPTRREVRARQGAAQ